VLATFTQTNRGEIADMGAKVITTDEMNEQQALAWKSLFDSWLRDKFRPALKALDYKQDCIQCGDIYFVTQFHIDQKGQVSTFAIVHEEIDCHGKTAEQNDKLRKTITNDFKGWIFPASLRNLIIEARMGQVTRC
jgi:hypothetical protein